MSHIEMSRVTYRNESRQDVAVKTKLDDIRVINHFTHMDKPCHTCELSHGTSTSHVTFQDVAANAKLGTIRGMSHVTHMNEPCQISMSHVTFQDVAAKAKSSDTLEMSHVIHMNESCHISASHVTFERVMSHFRTWPQRRNRATFVKSWAELFVAAP